MATLSTEKHIRKDGTVSLTYRVLVGGGRQPRRTIRLGVIPAAVATEAKRRIESLETAKATGTSIDRPTAAWVASVSDMIHERLARVGLVEPREPNTEKFSPRATRLGEHIDRYIASRSNLKPNTLRNYNTTKRLLLEHFGGDRAVDTVTAGDARDYKEWLRGRYAQATVSREVKRARQFFEYACDHRLIIENPFKRIKAGGQTNRKRKEFVDHDRIERVLEACPTNIERLLVVLARYAGLRIPSELERLTWDKVDWDRGRMTIEVPKKEHLDGHETRVIPIFAEVEPYLRQAFDEAPVGSLYVLPQKYHEEGNAYAAVVRAIEKASVQRWQKLFVNMRASRETELNLEYPAHVVCEWIGNSQAVADAHYNMVTDADFEKATSYPAQNPAQTGAINRPQKRSRRKKTAVTPAKQECTTVYAPPRGVEPRFSD